MGNPYQWTMLGAIGGELLEVRDGYAKGRLPLSEKVMQPTRVFHAGAIVTLADEVASAAIHGGAGSVDEMIGKPFPYSVQLSVSLLTNDAVGPLEAEATVIRRGRMTVVDTVVTNSKGETAALLRSTHVMVDLNKQGPHSTQALSEKAGC